MGVASFPFTFVGMTDSWLEASRLSWSQMSDSRERVFSLGASGLAIPTGIFGLRWRHDVTAIAMLSGWLPSGSPGPGSASCEAVSTQAC